MMDNIYLLIIFTIKLKQCYNVLDKNKDGLINGDLVTVKRQEQNTIYAI